MQIKTVDPPHFPSFTVLKLPLAYVCNEYEEERKHALNILPQCPVLYLKVHLMYNLCVRALFVEHCHQIPSQLISVELILMERGKWRETIDDTTGK
jgi:hypothetical protein